jgi:plasmid stabilization system protein ParE
MNYTVVWKPEAERRLADLWLAASDRAAVTRAANRIDQLLQTNPDQQGESRGRGRRILIEAPLGILFVVKPADRIVQVLTVWRFKTR